MKLLKEIIKIYVNTPYFLNSLYPKNWNKSVSNTEWISFEHGLEYKHFPSYLNYHLGRDARTSVFGVSDKVRF